MNTDFIDPFLSSTSNVIVTMATLEINAGKASRKGTNRSYGDITGIISMSGDQIRGSMALSFSKKMILDIAKRMLDQDIDRIDNQVVDLVGELTNMVSGGAKKLLFDKGFDFEMATPLVISGKHHQVKHHFRGHKVVIPFSSDAGDCFVEICFEKK